MPTLSESLAKAKEAQGSAEAQPNKRRRSTDLAAGDAPGSSMENLAEMLEHSLRLGATLADKVEGAVSATNVVVLLCSQQYKDSMLASLQQWLDGKPEFVRGAAPVPHPLGEKRLFLFASFLDLLVKDLDNHPAQSAVKEIQAMDSDCLLRWISHFRPRYNQPKEGRPWVFELSLSVLGNDSFRQAMDTMAQHVRLDSCRIEPQRWSQTQIQRQVWEDLRKFTASRR